MSPPRSKNQALAAILFLYKHVLERELGWLDDVIRARRSVHVPEVLSPDRVRTHTLRHSFATHFLESGSDIRTVAAPRLGHPASLCILHPWSRAHSALAALVRP